MFSSCSATVFSTAIRSRITSAIARFSPSSSLSLAIVDSSVSRSPADDLEHPVLLDPLGLDRDDPLAVLLRDGDLAGLVLPLDAELLVGAQVGAVWALSRSSRLDLLGLGLLAGPHGLDLAALLDLRVGLPALQLEDRLRASTFCRVISFSSLRRNSLVRTFSIAVSSVIFRMPCASRMLRRVELVHRRLLEEVDRRVLEAVAVEVGADHLR